MDVIVVLVELEEGRGHGVIWWASKGELMFAEPLKAWDGVKGLPRAAGEVE